MTTTKTSSNYPPPSTTFKCTLEDVLSAIKDLSKKLDIYLGLSNPYPGTVANKQNTSEFKITPPKTTPDAPKITDHERQQQDKGKIVVIGGCREYTEEPYFSAISTFRIGADSSHVFYTDYVGPVIKSYSPELIVHPMLEESYNIRDEENTLISAKIIAEIGNWINRFDCIVIGPGLEKDPCLLDCVIDIMKHARQADDGGAMIPYLPP